ncbi:MAG: hypothetical protein ABI416_07070 [Ginsengibacter sp.]
MIFFKILWAIDALVSLIVLYFFFEGLGDGTVSSGNMGLWLIILIILAAVMLGSIWFNTNGHPGLAKTTLCLLAIPSILYGFFILILILSDTRWN